MQAHIQTLMDYFEAEGFRAELDEDGDIRFKYEGLAFVLCFDATDPAFGKLILANVWQIDSPAELALALAVLDNLNRKVKMAKGHTQGDQVWFTVELLLEEPSGWTAHVQRCIRALAHALSLFAARMREGDVGGADAARPAPAPRIVSRAQN
ncbi:hypothetical protein [Massilia sp. DWR3-1-1]|uniref:hypothetical protein n=1 Tax=Massilia sp. DWR3-1-1 TaxID=2804559 RepID=UPI003CF279D7